MKWEPSTLTITILAVLVFLIAKFNLVQRIGPQPRPATADDFDIWTTPYYLRSNVPIPDYLATLMPVQSNYTYALGVPSAPYTQAAVIGGTRGQ
jgi:hypothetical protein